MCDERKLGGKKSVEKMATTRTASTVIYYQPFALVLLWLEYYDENFTVQHTVSMDQMQSRDVRAVFIEDFRLTGMMPS